jgi:hypothetical protein
MNMIKVGNGIRLSRYLVVFMSIFYAFSSPASTISNPKKIRKFPLGCREKGFSFENNVLSLHPNFEGKKYDQTLYFLHNITHQNIELTIKKAVGQRFGPNYKNVITPDNWAVFSLDFQHFKFICKEKSFFAEAGAYGNDCSKLLEVCQYNNAKFAEHNLGTYWTVANKSRKHAVKSAIEHGILLRS